MVSFVILVIGFGLPEFFEGIDLDGDRLFIAGTKILNLLIYYFLFLRVLIKNNRSVLGAYIRSLSVFLGWIHRSEIDVHKGGIIHYLRIIPHFHSFCMTGFSCIALLIGGILGMTTGVTRDGFFYALDTL